MKTVFKKMLSLVLVAMLLVSAVPFQAFAAEDSYEFTVVVDGDEWIGEDADGTLTAEELYDFMEMAPGDDEAFDAWVAKNTPKNVTSGEVVLTYSSDSGEEEEEEDVCPDCGEDPCVCEEEDVCPDCGEDPCVCDEEEDKDDDNEIDGEPMPDDVVVKCDLTIDYKLSGYAVKTVKASVGKLYKNYVGVPARGGYDFLGWYSDDYGRIIDVDKDIIKGDDTITGMWSEAKQFTLTLDENRGKTESVNYGKKVTYGQAIGALPTPERDGYVFAGWKLNGKIITKDTIWELQGDGTAYAQWKLESDTEGEAMNGTHTADGKVYLEIYINGETDKYAKRVNITDYAKDNKITLKEAKTVAAKYVTAKSGYSLKYIGLFDEEAWWWYTRDPETNGSDSVTVNRDGDDYVYIMVKNVKKTTADDSNPKTGDNIMMATSVMTMSAAALAVVFYLNKKRLVK